MKRDMIATHTHRRSKLERIVFGEPAAQAVAAEAALVGARKVLVISNRSLAREGRLLAGIVEALGERCAGTYTGIRSHSPASAVFAAVAMAREQRADLLVAVGGGSVIDSAKIGLIAYLNNIDSLEQLKSSLPYRPVDSSWISASDTAPAARVVAVPTTLSAAEFSWTGGITDEAAGVKLPFGHPLMVPRTVVLDPLATVPTPDELFLSTGIRSVDHAAERLASSLSTPMCDATAMGALTLLARSLREIKQDRTNREARLAAQTGTWMSVAGEESGVPVGASHAIGRVLGVFASMPHGFTSCVLLPATMRWNATANAERQKHVATALGAPGEAAGDVIAALVRDLGLPGRLREVGVTRDMFPELARQVFEGGGTRNNPRPVRSPADIAEILEFAW
jgi:maleylacetate reductase